MQATQGARVRAADSVEATERYLNRNPGLSFVGMDNNQVIACAMCSHDGRRGYLKHVFVLPEYRKQGIASALVERYLTKLEAIDIFKTHVDVIADNEIANEYWLHRGWVRRDDVNRYSCNRSLDINV